MTRETDVIVIGAGMAGLAAARTFCARGIGAIVLEASNRVGGRAYTTHPPELGGCWFDHGAMWLHTAERNPLVPLAQAAGETLLASDTFRTERTFIGCRQTTAEEDAAYEATWPTYTEVADAILANQADAPLSAVAERMGGNRWAHSVENWEGPVINVADPDKFSLRDWRRNQLDGTNLIVPGGIGAFAERVLAPMATDVRFNCPVHRIGWKQAGGGVSVETPRGTLRAGAVIITVSTGVLTGGAIAFDPPLPADIRAGLHALPMGLALKIAFRPTGADRLGLPDHCSLDRRIVKGEGPAMVFSCWPTGRRFISGWVGGSRAWELDRAGPRAIEDFARSELRKSLGSRADRALEFALITQWGQDPHYRGAYAFARPGFVEARERLQAPFDDGQVWLAGEAYNGDGLAGTLAGAWNSGVRAAEGIAALRDQCRVSASPRR